MLVINGMIDGSEQVTNFNNAEVYLNGNNVGGYGRMTGESDWDFGDEVNMIASFAVRENHSTGSIVIKLF